MKFIKILLSLCVGASLAVLLPACSEKKLPEVSDEVIGTANVAPRGFVLANSMEKYGANLCLNDGDAGTVFDSGALEDDGSFFIDLKTAYDVTGVRLVAAAGAEELFPAACEVQYSEDGRNYVTLAAWKDGEKADGCAEISVKKTRTRYIRVVISDVPTDSNGVRRYALSEVEVLANITAKNNIDLYQDSMWIYTDTNASLCVNGYRVANAENPQYSYFSGNPSVVGIDENGCLIPVAAGDADVYVYDGKNLAACRVRVIDDSGTSFRISAFYHSDFAYADRIAECVDYVKNAGITFLEDTRTYDRNGNQICDYMMYLCAERDIFYSVCDPNRHLTAHLNLLPNGGFPSWKEYISDFCAVSGTAGIRNRYLSFDYYCFTKDGGFAEEAFGNLYSVNRTGLQYNFDTGYYMQGFGNSSTLRVPSYTDLIYNASLCVAYGVKNCKWFVFLTPLSEDYVTGIIGRDYLPSVMYDGVCTVNKRLLEYGRILGKSDAIEVYHTKAVSGTPALPENFVLYPKKADDAIWTLYRSYEDGRQYVTVVNKNLEAEHSFTMYTANDLKSLEVYRNGGWETVEIKNGRITETIAAGELALFRLPESYTAVREEEKTKNLALGCPVYVTTSAYNFWNPSDTAAYMLTDGKTDEGGYLAAESALYTGNPVLTLDLGSPQEIGGIGLYAMAGKEEFGKIKIAGSADGTEWIDICDIGDIRTAGKKVTFDTVSVRFLRLTFGTRNAALGEIEVYAGK